MINLSIYTISIRWNNRFNIFIIIIFIIIVIIIIIIILIILSIFIVIILNLVFFLFNIFRIPKFTNIKTCLIYTTSLSLIIMFRTINIDYVINSFLVKFFISIIKLLRPFFSLLRNTRITCIIKIIINSSFWLGIHHRVFSKKF